MRKYEVVFVFRSEEESFAKGKTYVIEELTRIGGKIEKEEDMGNRDLAYQIKKQTRGHYFLFELTLDPLKIVDVEGNFRLSPEILKYLFIKLDD